jgi:hypothetical protein
MSHAGENYKAAMFVPSPPFWEGLLWYYMASYGGFKSDQMNKK